MKRFLSRWWCLALSLAFALAVAVFWAVPYVGALNYQEQYQLFLWTTDYLLARLARPGGAAAYLSEMITQFNYLPVLGAALIALLFLALQRLTWAVSRRLGAHREWYILSFVPVVALWLYQADPNVLQAFTIALIAALALLRALVARQRLHPLLLIIILALFYWLCGTAVYVVAVAVAIGALRRRKVLLALTALVAVPLLIYGASYLLPFPLQRLFVGLFYYRYPVGVPAMQWGVMALTLLTPFITACLPRVRVALVSAVLTVALLAAAAWGVRSAYDDETHTLLTYDYLARAEKWDAIIARAQRTPATAPLDVSVVNLALSQKGQLLDRLFHFYQNGGEGLFPDFSRDILSLIPTAEVFFRLGLVNDCERYCFEALQAIPDFQRSGRLLKRITQCEVANGQYAVAQRYLRVLEKSTFYRRWARATRALIADDDAVSAHPTYRYLRACREQRGDYLFSEREMDQMVGLLLMNNDQNRMAYEYLIAYELLQRDLQHFNEYYALGRTMGYKRIPTAVQEVLIGLWLQEHNTLQGLPYTVDDAVVRATVDFLNIYLSNHSDARLSQAPMKNNAWHYLLLGATATNHP